MPLPEVLQEQVDMLRTAATKANAINYRSLVTNANSHLGTIRQYIEHDDGIMDALTEAMTKCEELADEIQDQGVMGMKGNSALDNARSQALLAVEVLERELRAAKPNAVAAALGVAWM